MDDDKPQQQSTLSRKARLRQQLFAIAAEQGWLCYWCGWPIDELTATREHLVPRTAGGTNLRVNIVAACLPCNHKRGCDLTPPAGYIRGRINSRPVSVDSVQPQTRSVR